MNKKRLIASALGVTFDVAYAAVLARGSALGYTLPTPAQQIKQNAYVLALKAAGIWALLDVLYVFATNGDSNFATLNWKAPTLFKCAKVNSPTFTANQGFTGNGTTSYLSTGWVPSVNGVNYVLNDASFGLWINTEQAAGNDIVCGCDNGVTADYLICERLADGQPQSVINSALSQTAPVSTSLGFWGVNRTAAAVTGIFKNGVLLAAGVPLSSARTNREIFIGGRNNSGVFGNGTTKQFSNFWAGASLNGLELANYNAWNTYFTSL